MPDYATSEEDAEARYQRYKSLDPFPDIQPALLNSADIIDYVATAGMVFPFHEEARLIKPASYGVALCGRCVYWQADGSCEDFILSRRNLDGYEHVPHRREFVLKRNSIAFVTLEPTFRLPDYIALRFNLAIREVYRGLLLGTGPLVDPGFEGKLSFPLQNLTDEDYFFRPEEHVVWMEFTKVSMWNAWRGGAPQPRSGTPPYQLQKEKKEREDVRDYLHHANSGRPVKSSIPVAIETATKAAVSSQATANRIAEMSIIGALSLAVAFVAFGLTIYGTLSGILNTTTLMTNSVRSEWDTAVRSRLPLIDELSRKLDELKRSDDANEFRIRNLENAIASLKSEIAESSSTRIGRTKKR